MSRPITTALGWSLCALTFAATNASAQAPAASPTPAAPTAAATPATANDFGSQIRFKVDKYVLPNGLTVLLTEDHSAPIISYQTWFRVGSKNEEPGLTGIAHLFEHMMFKGAKRYGQGMFETILQANGATNNAFTTNDYTGYYENMPSSKLELVMDIESDRMENLQITAENLKSEREVVKEERRYRVDNNPSGILRENIMSTVFKVHPYRWPVIGYMQDLDNVNVENATKFYRTFYAPNNAVLVIAGDFNTDAAKKMIEKYYGPLKSQTLPDRPRPPEPEQKSPRSQELRKEVQSIQFAITFPAPKAGSDESYALDLVGNIMGSGTSSRLHQRLVYKDQLATSVAAYNYTLQDAGLFQVFVTLKPGANWDRAYKAVYGELWRPANMKIKDDELQKAKNQMMKSYVDGLKTIHGKAEALVLNEIMFGDYERLFHDLERYQKVTADDMRKAAAKYLVTNKSNLVVLRPLAKPKKGAAQ